MISLTGFFGYSSLGFKNYGGLGVLEIRTNLFFEKAQSLEYAELTLNL